MKKIIFTLCLISGVSSLNAQNREMLDTLSKSEIKMMFDYFSSEIISLKKTIQSIDSCHYNHEKYLFSEAINADTNSIVKSPWEFLKFNVLSAHGDRTNQSVTVTLLVQNSGLNQKIYIDPFEGTAIDPIGNSAPYAKKGVNLSQGFHSGTIFTNVPQKIELTFVGVLPGTDKFNLVAFKMSSTDVNSSNAPVKKQVEIQNIEIEW